MAWAWVVLVVVAAGIPVAVGLRSRSLKPPREPYGSPVPKLDRVDRWLYDQYQLGNLDGAQINQAVIEGRELTDPRLRPAAHGLAAAMLTGQVGVLTRRTERKLLGAVLGLMIAIAAVALATGKFTILLPAVTGVALLPVSARMWTRDRRRVERARQLNAQAARHVPIRPARMRQIDQVLQLPQEAPPPHQRPRRSAGTRAPQATSAVTLCDQVACDPRRAVPNRPQIIQPLDVQIARAVTPPARSDDSAAGRRMVNASGVAGF